MAQVVVTCYMGRDSGSSLSLEVESHPGDYNLASSLATPLMFWEAQMKTYLNSRFDSKTQVMKY